jgi:hypothetical protein
MTTDNKSDEPRVERRVSGKATRRRRTDERRSGDRVVTATRERRKGGDRRKNPNSGT